jgi:prepilin-type N-terminal cleavage/methylation domain-containing protein
MKIFNNQSGFNIIEIIIVLLIIGILAAIALPAIVNNVPISQAVSAIKTAGEYKQQIDNCILSPVNNKVVPGNTPCDLKSLFGAPTQTQQILADDANFTINLAPGGNVNGAFVPYTYPAAIIYTLTGKDSTGIVAFTLQRNPGMSVICIPGAGVYASAC